MTKAKSLKGISADRTRGVIAATMLFAFAVWLGVSIIGGVSGSAGRGNLGGPAGELVSARITPVFGYAALFIPLLLMIWSFARVLSLSGRKIALLSGEIVAGHAILAALLGLPGSSLSIHLVGSYGGALAAALRAAFGSFGAYVAAIAFFLFFVAAITRLDVRGTLRAAGDGVANTKRWILARKRRRESRREASREEIFEKYNSRVHAERSQNVITGSIVPGEVPKLIEKPTSEPLPEPIESDDDASYSYMEYIPPPIKRAPSIPSVHSKPAGEKSETPLPPPEPPRTIDPKEFAHKADAEKPNIPLLKQPSFDKPNEVAPIIGHEPPLPEPVISDNKPTMPNGHIVSVSETKMQPPPRPRGPYRYTPPPLDILIDPEPDTVSVSDEALHQQSKRLMETLHSFNVDGEIREICPGPVITRYELEPAVGVKVSRISNLADDIALALRAQDIRIVAPIPGKGAVGIEVPNDNIQTVRIKSELASSEFLRTKFRLPLALGKRVDGTPAIADLTRMPHLLIAGSTGSGKSVCINSMLTSIIYSNSPEDVRLVLIDPKRLELSVYKGIPHLAAPIVVEPKHASVALNWAIEEMEARYKKLSEVGVRSIADFNRYVESHKGDDGLEKLPYIVVVIDELADLMVTVSSEIEEPIARLAQMARAIGIHLIIATQRPSVDVITGLIKANFPSRIAFKVRSKIDSRTILDMGGAERLLGRGDMLYLPSGYADPIRIHGCLVTTEETEHIVKYLQTFPNPYPDDMIDLDEQQNIVAMRTEQDELFWEAAKIVVMYKQGSTSFLQRKLRIGYTRAGCIIDQLEQAGIVGPFQGSKARDVLVEDLSTIDEMRSVGT
ncbi:DNA translocase FtsK [bacterium]|nr:DNA translocase FtsK [bacterium]